MVCYHRAISWYGTIPALVKSHTIPYIPGIVYCIPTARCLCERPPREIPRENKHLTPRDFAPAFPSLSLTTKDTIALSF